MKAPESENKIFNILSVCSMCACVCVYHQHYLKTNYSKNIKFGILHLYHIQMLLEMFYKDQIKTVYRGTQKNSNTLKPMEGISCYINFECL